jgi:anti-sigma-K factor RskA
MHDLIHRYLDGELSEDEARALREAIASDPRVDTELREWERVLGAAAGAESGAPSAEFTDRVMRRVVGRRAAALQGLRALFDVRWPARLAWAATLVVAFGLGALLIGDGGDLFPGSPATPPGTQPAAAPELLPDEAGMRVVRLVYAPSDPQVSSVRVAGTFNGWDPGGTALERRGDVWTVVLILPRGTYEYMYVEDDNRWVTDPLALQTRDDGFGRKNAVLDLTL